MTRAGSLFRAERLETVPGRTAAADVPGGPRAPDQASGAGGVRVGCPLVGRLCHRGDPAGAGRGGGICPRPRTVLLRPADLPGHCRSALAGDLQLPPDHPRLPLGRRGVHRGQGEPGHHRGADGRRGPAGGLRLDGVGLRRRRCGGGHLGGPGHGLGLAGGTPGGPVRRHDRPCRPGQPAGHPRVGTHLRSADLPVPLQLPRHDRLGPGVLRAASGRGGDHGGRGPEAGGGVCAPAAKPAPPPGGFRQRLYGPDGRGGDL